MTDTQADLVARLRADTLEFYGYRSEDVGKEAFDFILNQDLRWQAADALERLADTLEDIAKDYRREAHVLVNIARAALKDGDKP